MLTSTRAITRQEFKVDPELRTKSTAFEGKLDTFAVTKEVAITAVVINSRMLNS